jgi:hypothetical protein
MGVCCFLIILVSGLAFELKMADQQVSFDEFFHAFTTVYFLFPLPNESRMPHILYFFFSVAIPVNRLAIRRCVKRHILPLSVQVGFINSFFFGF